MTWKQRLAERIDHEMLRRYAEAEEMWVRHGASIYLNDDQAIYFSIPEGASELAYHNHAISTALLTIAEAHDVCPCAAVEIIRRAAGESS